MKIHQLGFTTDLEAYIQNTIDSSFIIGRVIAVHKDRYEVKTTEKELNAEIIGRLRFAATDASDFPVTGDWVAMTEYNEGSALIHHVLPRTTILARQAVGKTGQKQIIATNVDYAFIVQSVGHNFNINRIERYLTIIRETNITPIIVITKIDLISDDTLKALTHQLEQQFQTIPYFTVSHHSDLSVSALLAHIQPGKTYCLLGSSGVGKSTLINLFLGYQKMFTQEISLSNQKGLHSTTHRELIILKNGGIIIDTPGMREIGIVDNEKGMEETFETIHHYATLCKFSNCRHLEEKGCAVVEAVATGEINEQSYHNFLKLAREKEHYTATISQRRKKDKDFGKMVKKMKKYKKRGF